MKQNIQDYLDGLTPDEQADIAGYLMQQAGVSRETTHVFLQELSTDNQDELKAQMEDIAYSTAFERAE